MFRLLERRRQREISAEVEVPEIPEEFKRIPPEMEEALRRVMAGHRSPTPPASGKSELPSATKVKTY
jgi:hypothetical protein